MKTVTCTKCPKKFTKPNTASADQALRMHVGRVHSRNIAPPNAHDGIVHLHGRNGKHPRSKLSREQASSIVGFIQTNRDRYPNKQACFNAALDELGLADRLNKTSTSTARYFAKAESAGPAKRKYTKRQNQPVAHEVRVNFCPACGCNIHAVATGMATALLK
jgi:hypothetical protein